METFPSARMLEIFVKMNKITKYEHSPQFSSLGKMYNREKYKMTQYEMPDYRSSPSIPSNEQVQDERGSQEMKSTEHGRKVWYLGETIKKLYDLDQNPTRKLFLDEYFSFMKARGATVTKVPVVAKFPLDLFSLYHVVQKLGGFAQVVKKRRWSRVVRELDLPSSITSAAFTLRTQYMRLLYPYECEKKGIPNRILYYEDKIGWNPETNHHYEYLHKFNEQSPRLLQGEVDITNKKSNYQSKYNKLHSELLSHSEDNICLKSRADMQQQKMGIDSPLSPITKRAKSEELDRNVYLNTPSPQIYRPHSFDSVLLPRPSVSMDDTNMNRRHSDGDAKKNKIVTPNGRILAESPVVRVETEYVPIVERMLREDKNRNETDKQTKITDVEEWRCKVYPAFRYFEGRYNEDPTRDYKDCIACRESPVKIRTPIPALPKIARVNSHMKNGYPYNRPYYPESRFHPQTSRTLNDRTFVEERNGYKRRYVDLYKSPIKNVRLSTNPSEMNITIEDRTETAMALSISVNGIRYTGTLLSNIQRT